MTADARSDALLIAAVTRGDWSAFDVLYFRHRDWTYRLALRFCAHEADALDVVQETFVYLAGKCREGLDLRASLTTLLYPAVKHLSVAHRRKARRAAPGMGEEEQWAAPVPPADPGTLRGELAGALAGLSPAHREVLLMRFVDDMTLEEIAAALAIPLGTVKSRLHHAVEAVKADDRIVNWLRE